MLHWLYYILLLLVLLTGLLLNVFTLPGNWIMFLAVAVYGWVTHWAYFGKWWLIALLATAVSAEVLEFVAAGSGAKKAGATIWGTVGALLGAVLGGIFLTGLIPVPVLGTIAGIILGTFLGAMLAEFMGGKEIHRSAWVGVGAAKGRVYGTLLKLASGCLMLILALIAALPLGRGPVAPPPTPPAPPVVKTS